MTARIFFSVPFVLALSTGCTARLGDEAGSFSDAGDSSLLADSPGGVELSCEEGAELAPSPLLKLSTTQYRNTVRDLLKSQGLGSVVSNVEALLSSIPDDSLGEGFRGLDNRIALEHVQGFFDIGVAVGDALVDDPALLQQVAGECATASNITQECYDAFLDGFMTTVFRRPLRDSERTLLNGLNDGSRNGPELIRTAVVVGMSSPRFIYHVEIDGEDVKGDDTLLHLDAYEVASRLSYTFWQTMPDQQLLDKATDGTLLDEEVYAAELERVFQDPRAKETLRQFWTEWLKLEKFTGFETTRPAFQSLAEGQPIGEPGHDYYGDMIQEVHSLTDLITFDKQGTLEDLLTTNLSVTQSEDLASLYGVPVWDGTGPYPTFPEGERSGLLQRAALIVSNLEQTNPFHRGALIRRQFLCDPLPQPDSNELPPGSLDPPPADEAQTTRERFQGKVEGNTLCEGCHQSFSPIGYVMEAYDALGRYRTVEKVYDEQTGELLAELPIDVSAKANIESTDEPTVNGPQELNRVIVDSQKVEQCMAKSYFSYMARRAMRKSSLDACVVQDLSEVLAAKDSGLAAAFQRVARMPTFFSKKVGEQ